MVVHSEDYTYIQCLSGTHCSSCQNHVHGPREPNECRETDCPTIQEGNSCREGQRLGTRRRQAVCLTESPAEDPKGRVLLHHPKVAHEGQLQTACHRVAGDCCYHRLAEEQSGWSLGGVCVCVWVCVCVCVWVGVRVCVGV